MDKLPFEDIRQIYSYDPKYKDIFDKVLIPLKLHCFMYDVLNVINHITSAFVIAKHVEHI